ncbi:MAG: cysteine--tRNA ligase [Spirochaetota bacterium]
MGLRLYNTMGRKLEEFVPREEGRVGLYCCGPTVYNYAHIGNLRTYVFEDLLRRILERDGYEVNHVMNVTDVGHLTDDADEGEDKMLVGARERGMSVWEIAEHFTRAFFADVEKLNVVSPSVVCRATEHIEEMQALIKRLEENGLTYQAGGNVYFSIDAFPRYGELAQLERQELRSGARIEVDSAKRNPRDFVLWFTQSKFEHQAMQWDSPWGRGYPGWHLECSAMSMKYLGEQFDIHCGGVDHVNVHHTNEIAQSEGATGKPWVKYWLHGEFLVIPSGRMGKSEGNAITLSTLEERGYEPLDYRYFLLGAHYRTQLTFSWEALDAARSARASLTEQLRTLAPSGAVETPDHSPADSLGDDAGAALAQINAAFDDDLNAPRALGVLRAFLKKDDVPASQRVAVALDADRVFGLRLRDQLAPRAELAPELASLIARRERARAEKDFATADALREQLREAGVSIEDTPDGTKWKLE